MNFITRTLCLLSLTAWLTGCADQPPVFNVKMLDYGIYQGVAVVRQPAEAGQEPEVISVNVRNEPQETTTIPCRPDIYFGFRLDPQSLPSSCHLRLEYEHPAFMGKKGETLEVDEYDVHSREDFDGEIIYCFLDVAPHEMVPGDWKFRVIMDGQVVAEKSFQVVKEVGP